MRLGCVRIVSFSGIDGAGKSTQIELLCRVLQERGFAFTLLAFWDDVAAFSHYRERLSTHVFQGDQGVGSPQNPIRRRDKNVTAWHLTVGRLVLYMMDAFSLCLKISKNADSDVDFLIFDRFIYDELANLPLQHLAVRLYVRLLLAFVPRPDVALFLDAEPEAAVSRKPEYPIEFVRRNRDAYLRLSRLVHGITVVPPAAASDAAATIWSTISQKCLLRDSESQQTEVSAQLPCESKPMKM